MSVSGPPPEGPRAGERAKSAPTAGGDVIGERVDDKLRHALRRQQEFEREALPVARATAEKWAGTTALLFTALGFGAVTQGRKQITVLEPTAETWAGALLIGGFAVLLLAILLAAVASQGTSPTRALRYDTQAFLTFQTAEARRVQKWLNRSRSLSVIAILLVLGALSLLFFAHSDAEATGPQVLVVTKDGDLVCGKLLEQRQDGKLTIDPGGDSAERVVDTRSAVTVTSVSECPSDAP